ncbi:MAG: malate dehydrogenase [Candidatus Eisenbacteria bacterium]|uniref:Malate dehydrogenase n=1 Tax=Eiseniibacteriota bacterium TaxID=2212470 RepID=A0A9D6LAK2_UNCEI|nr:malate dehydrogenase [Candidatus Eisenbacteria bacterium]MBI3539084.1 malate dehydrogenase [Candidatus Eisenbacteria bacterium]
MKHKVAVIGAGNVGASAALFLAERALADVTLIDRPEMEGMPQGKALDMQQAAPIWNKGGRIEGASDLAAVKGSDVVVMTAGFPRKPGMSRTDLLKANADIVRPAAEAVKRHAPNAYVVVVTNPLDVMAHLFWKVSGFPKSRVMGMAGILDSARMRAFIAMELGVSGADVDAMVLGGHGDSMVPLPRFTTVNGIPITELLPADRVAAISERTRGGGAEIVKLLKTGSAYYAPAMSAVEMVEAILTDQKRLVPCSVLLEGEYGMKDLFIGVPIVLGGKGVEKIIRLELSADELAALQKSGKDVADSIAELNVAV